MTFIVTGLSEAGPTLLDCDTVTNAMEKAVELMRVGFMDVLIADGAGLQYTPAEFARLYHW